VHAEVEEGILNRIQGSFEKCFDDGDKYCGIERYEICSGNGSSS
jgi:hypothetical protein